MQRLRTEIIHGKLAPGERLVELDMAQRMGNSQGPVREALQMLERDGLVERRAHIMLIWSLMGHRNNPKQKRNPPACRTGSDTRPKS